MLGTRVAGLVLVHITYTNPVRSTTLARLNTALVGPSARAIVTPDDPAFTARVGDEPAELFEW
jgi:hypothetical protein